MQRSRVPSRTEVSTMKLIYNRCYMTKSQVRCRIKSKCEYPCSSKILNSSSFCAKKGDYCGEIMLGFCSSPGRTKFIFIFLLILICIAAVTTYLIFHYKEIRKNKISKTALTPPNVHLPLPPSYSDLHVFPNGAVCSDSHNCSNIGREVIYRGGNTIDATIATMFCIGLTTLQSMGIGGGFLMNIYRKSEGKAYTLDAREVAPLDAKKDMFVNKDVMASMKGSLSIGVPGEVMGYWEAHKRFGRMSWKEIIEPSIQVCESGFPLSRHMWDALHIHKGVEADPFIRASFYNETAKDFYKVGAHVKPPPQLCNTYRHLATNGGLDFYNGTLADLIADDLRDIQSIVRKEDLAEYKVHWRESLRVQLRNDSMFVVPPPGGGAILALIMNILDGYNITKDSLSNLDKTALLYHRTIEAFKFAFGRRSEMGDPDFTNMEDLVDNLLSPEYAAKRRESINDGFTNPDVAFYGAKFWTKDDKGTSHLSIVGPDGDAVSVTSTINFYFGSGHVGKRTGIIFNSVMNDFATPGVKNFFGLPSSEPNYIVPKKRPLSSMSPTIVVDSSGEVKLVIGSAGGTKIPTAIAWVILRVLYLGQDIKQAIDAARLHHQLVPNIFQYEFGTVQSVIDALEAKGHETHRYTDRGSAMCGIQKNATAVYANADFRKKGDVSGL